MKNKIVMMIVAAALFSCNNSKKENENTASAETVTAPVTANKEIDLNDKGLDGLQACIQVPEALSTKLQFAKSDQIGGLDINGEGDFKMLLVSNWADEKANMEETLKGRMETVKHNIDTLTSKIIMNEPHLVMWDYKKDDGKTGYHFFAVFPDGNSTFYSFEDDEDVLCSESTIRSMIDIARTVKHKSAPAGL